jgi:hypothetical protein
MSKTKNCVNKSIFQISTFLNAGEIKYLVPVGPGETKTGKIEKSNRNFC